MEGLLHIYTSTYLHISVPAYHLYDAMTYVSTSSTWLFEPQKGLLMSKILLLLIFQLAGFAAVTFVI